MFCIIFLLNLSLPLQIKARDVWAWWKDYRDLESDRRRQASWLCCIVPRCPWACLFLYLQNGDHRGGIASLAGVSYEVSTKGDENRI